MSMPHLYRIILPVSDIEEAASFYSAVFGTPGERVSPGRHYFQCGGTILACYDCKADGDEEDADWKFHPFQYLYFGVKDLEDTMERVRNAGGSIEGEIETMPWGERLFYARDKSGSQICFADETTLFTGEE